MKVFVVLDGLFTRNDGIPSSNNTAYDFYCRYLDVFDNVTIVARCFDVEDPTAAPVTGKDINFWVLPGYHGPQQLLRALPKIVPMLSCLLREKGAVILRLPATIPCALGLLLFILRRPYAVELVADPADAYSPQALRHRLSWFFQLLFTVSTRLLCRYATTCAYVTRDMLQSKYPANLAGEAFSYTSLDLKADAYVATPRFMKTFRLVAPRLLQVAMMQNYYKGHDIALKGLVQLREQGISATLRLVGDGPLRLEIENTAQRLGVEEAVSFSGKLPAGLAVWQEMDDADILVLPSRQEGLPRVVLEAMARAMPCVGSRVGGTPELLDDVQLMAQLTPEALAERVANLSANPNLLAACSERNRRLAEDFKYDNVRHVRQAFYQRVAEKTV